MEKSLWLLQYLIENNPRLFEINIKFKGLCDKINIKLLKNKKDTSTKPHIQDCNFDNFDEMVRNFNENVRNPERRRKL